MTTNSHMFTVRGTTFGAFCTASFFHPLLYSPRRWVIWKCSCSKREVPRLYCKSPPPFIPLASLIEVCLWERVKRAHPYVCLCVCVCGGCSCSSRSTKPGPCVEMQPPGWAVLSLPTSPAGSRGSSWLVALRLQTDGNGQRSGEVENQRESRGGGGGGGGIEWTEDGEREGREKESVCSH